MTTGCGNVLRFYHVFDYFNRVVTDMPYFFFFKVAVMTFECCFFVHFNKEGVWKHNRTVAAVKANHKRHKSGTTTDHCTMLVFENRCFEAPVVRGLTVPGARQHAAHASSAHS